MTKISKAVSEFIMLAGGVHKVADKTTKSPYAIQPPTVHKWRKIGVPVEHWWLFLEVGVTLEELFAVAETLRRLKTRQFEAQDAIRRARRKKIGPGREAA